MTTDAAPPAGRRMHPRNLVVVRAGAQSLHRQWTLAPSRDFDLFVSDYAGAASSGENSTEHTQEHDHHEHRPGPKWPGIAGLLREHAALVGRYDAVWFPDDDLAASTDTIDRMFAFFHAHRLHLAQPALTADSYFTWSTLVAKPGRHLRFTRFVEVMAPIFSRQALAACAPSFDESRSGWGLDWLWPRLCQAAGLEGIAVIDATPVRHTRPMGGGDLYRNHPELDPRRDAERVLARHGLAEVRAVAKYSVEREVRSVAVPALTRLVFWIKRLNGRRKHVLSS